MSGERRVATVFGGSGFIGRHIVQRLAAKGFVVRVAVRRVPGALFLQTMGDPGQIVPLYAPLGAEALVARATEGAELVVNATGLLSEKRKGDFTRVHAEGAGRIARLAASSGARQVVHLSAIGADAASPSAYGRSKAEGEAAVRAAFSRAVILRPSIVFGPEDAFFNRFAAMAGFLPVLPIVGADVKFQPVYVGDVAAAVQAALSAEAAGKTFELGGPEVRTFRQLLEYMLKIIGRKRVVMDLPPGVARLQAQLLQRLPGKLLTTDQIKLLQRDNIVTPGAPGLAALGIVPTPMDLVVPGYLRRYAVR
jgi:NADH dehydrogenase